MDLRGETTAQFDNRPTSLKEARVLCARDVFVGIQSDAENDAAGRGISFSFRRGETFGREEAIPSVCVVVRGGGAPFRGARPRSASAAAPSGTSRSRNVPQAVVERARVL